MNLYLLGSAYVLILASFVSADVNWSKYNIYPVFANAPKCNLTTPIPGWSTLKNADGTLFTKSKRPIVLLAQQWDSSFLTTYAMQFLLEAMGYRVNVVVGTDNFTPSREFYDNIVDLELEIWPSDTPALKNLTKTDGVAVSMGAIGYSGNAGFYVPTYMITKYPTLNFDFWRSYYNPQIISYFPPMGTGPRLDAPLSTCDGDPTSCINGTYTPLQCRGYKSNCAELWGYDPSYSPDMVQRLLDGSGLNFTINFLGPNATQIILSAMAAKKNILFYNWSPSAFTSVQPITRVLLPGNNPSEYYKFSTNRSAPLTTDFPTQILTKLSSQQFLIDFPELEAFVGVFNLADSVQRQVIRQLINGKTYGEVMCAFLNANNVTWLPWIPTAPQSVDNCPIGFGRYNQGTFFQCVVCPSGTFNWKENTTDVCEHCPDNMDCPGGSTVNVLTGDWMAAKSVYPYPVFYPCPFPEACCQNSTCPPGTCAHGATGPLCMECVERNHYMWNSECRDCSSGPGLSLLGIVLGALMVAILLLCLPYEEVPTVEILFFYFQVAGCIFGNQLEVGGLKFLVPFLAVVTLDIDRIVNDCTLPIAGVSKLLFRFLLPALMLGFIGVIFVAVKMARNFGFGGSMTSWTPYYMRGQSMSLICFRAGIVAVMFLVMPLVDASLKILPCTEIEGKYVVHNAPEVLCYSQEHLPGFIFALIVIALFLVVLPIGLALILRKLYLAKRIIYETEDVSHAQQLFQCFYLVFKPEMFFMLPITIMEKGVVAMVFTLLNNLREDTQVNIYLIFLGFLCSTRIYWQPYHSHLEAFLNREICLCILILIGFRIYLDVFNPTQAIMAQIGTIIILPLALHALRWLAHNYEKHEGSIKGMASKMGTAASKFSTGSKSSLSKSFTDIRVTVQTSSMTGVQQTTSLSTSPQDGSVTVPATSPTAVAAKRGRKASIELTRPMRTQSAKRIESSAIRPSDPTKGSLTNLVGETVTPKKSDSNTLRPEATKMSSANDLSSLSPMKRTDGRHSSATEIPISGARRDVSQIRIETVRMSNVNNAGENSRAEVPGSPISTEDPITYDFIKK